jgi:hypothetical protein
MNPYSQIGDWQADIITQILVSGTEENQYLEYKEVLEDRNANPKQLKEYKLKIEHECCSFANAKGGFILFGISDDKIIKGITLKPDQEFNLILTQILINSTPKIDFQSKQIIIDNKNIFVVYIEECLDKPVQCSDGSFYMRFNGKSDILPKDYLREIFINIETKKQRYEKLMFEIEYVWKVLERNSELNGGVIFPIFYELRLNEIQETISNYYGYFKPGAGSSIIEINKIIAELKKWEKFFEMILTLESRKNWGNSWTDFNSFTSSDHMKREFSKINTHTYDLLKSLRTHLQNLKEYI